MRAEIDKRWWVALTEKQVKILRLALNDAACDGERQSASLMFVQSLRRDGSMPVREEEKREASRPYPTGPEERRRKDTYQAKEQSTGASASTSSKRKVEGATLGNCGDLHCRWCAYRLWFGKWKDHQMHQVDSSYLNWMEANIENAKVREAACHVLEARNTTRE